MLVYTSQNGDVNLPFLSPAGIGQAANAAPVAAGSAPPLAAGNVSITGTLNESVLTGITAGTTHTLVGATPLTGQFNNITVCANAADAVALPAANAAQIGNTITVCNNGAAAAAVWPQAADKIDGGSAGVAVTLTNPKRCSFTCISLNNWISVVSPGASS